MNNLRIIRYHFIFMKFIDVTCNQQSTGETTITIFRSLYFNILCNILTLNIKKHLYEYFICVHIMNKFCKEKNKLIKLVNNIPIQYTLTITITIIDINYRH